jgi:hypothetical protein
MSGLATYIIIMLVLAAITIFVSVRAYNRRLDRIASGEARDTHSSIPEPSATVGAVYRIVLMVLAVITLLTVSAVSGKINSMQNDLGNLRSALNRMSGEMEELQRQLEDGKKIVSRFEWDVREPDYAAGTATVYFSAALKEYSADTAVTLNLGGRTVELTPTADPGEYGGRFNVGFFEEFSDPTICVSEGGKTFAEPCEFTDYVFWEFLPMPSIECRFSSGMKMGKLTYEGSYTIVPDHLEDVESVTVTYLTNGKEIKTFDATRQTLEREEITLEKGMDLDRDLCIRISIVTKSGFRIEEQTVAIFEATPDYEDTDYLRIMDLNGKLLWEDDRK